MATEKVGMTVADFEAGMQDLDGSAEYKNILVYGGPGCGKTVLSGTVPGRLLILAGEPGYISAARMGARGKVRLIPDTATATAALRWLEDGGANQFDWVVADGLGTMQNKFLLDYAAEAFDQNPAKRTHRNLPDKPDYFNAQNFVKSWVAGLIDLPCNTLFTAHAMFPEDKETGERLVFPSIQGKGYEVSNYICGLMHAVGYMSPRVVKRGDDHVQARRILWQTIRDPDTETTFFAKDQFNGLGPATYDLPMPTLLKMMDDGNPEAPAPAPIEAVAAAPKATAGRPAGRPAARRAPARRAR